MNTPTSHLHTTRPDADAAHPSTPARTRRAGSRGGPRTAKCRVDHLALVVVTALGCLVTSLPTARADKGSKALCLASGGPACVKWAEEARAVGRVGEAERASLIACASGVTGACPPKAPAPPPVPPEAPSAAPAAPPASAPAPPPPPPKPERPPARRARSVRVFRFAVESVPAECRGDVIVSGDPKTVEVQAFDDAARGEGAALAEAIAVAEDTTGRQLVRNPAGSEVAVGPSGARMEVRTGQCTTTVSIGADDPASVIHLHAKPERNADWFWGLSPASTHGTSHLSLVYALLPMPTGSDNTVSIGGQDRAWSVDSGKSVPHVGIGLEPIFSPYFQMHFSLLFSASTKPLRATVAGGGTSEEPGGKALYEPSGTYSFASAIGPRLPLGYVVLAPHFGFLANFSNGSLQRLSPVADTPLGQPSSTTTGGMMLTVGATAKVMLGCTAAFTAGVAKKVANVGGHEGDASTILHVGIGFDIFKDETCKWSSVVDNKYVGTLGP